MNTSPVQQQQQPSPSPRIVYTTRAQTRRQNASKQIQIQDIQLPQKICPEPTNNTVNFNRIASTFIGMIFYPFHSISNLQNIHPKKMSTRSQTSATPVPIAVASTPSICDSVENGLRQFKYVVNPINVQEFVSEYWEKKPLCVNRRQPNYFKELISIAGIDEMLRSNMIEYTENINVTNYVDGVRETHYPNGRALPSGVWDFYRGAYTIHLSNPHKYVPQIDQLNAVLQEYFHCKTRANVHLTPPNSQESATHCDDSESFVLQVDGKKIWRVYAPRAEKDQLARVPTPSDNLSTEEIGELISEETLEAGDLLYFPRGFICEARPVPGSLSLHITLSVYQKMAYGDLLEISLQQALQSAIDSDIEFRRGLPLNIWREFGVVNSATDSRTEILTRIKNLFGKIIQYADFDSAVDQMALKYQHDALPPVISEQEKDKTVYGTKTRLKANGNAKTIKMDIDTEYRLLRANIIRTISHENTLRIYFYANNSKDHHKHDLNYIEAAVSFSPVIKCLIKSYPHYVRLSQMPLAFNKSFTLIHDLWAHGLLMTRETL